MRQLLFSIIKLLMLSFMLTACSAAQRTDVEDFKSCPDGQNVLPEQECPLVPTVDDGTNSDGTHSDSTVLDENMMLKVPIRTAEIGTATITLLNVQETVPKKTGDVAYDSLTAITFANPVTSDPLTLQGLAVVRNYTTDYKRDATTIAWKITGENEQMLLNEDEVDIEKSITLSSPLASTLPALTLKFAGNGSIQEATAHISSDYTVMGGEISSENPLSRDGIIGIDAGADADITDDDVVLAVDRISIFGFTDDKGTDDTKDDVAVASNYMVYARWSLGKEANLGQDSSLTTETSEDIDGAMIVGFETLAMPTKSEVTFKGKGKGTYGRLTKATADEVESYDTVFDVTAEVDFGTGKIVTISSSNTCLSMTTHCTVENTDDWKDSLNFTTGEIDITDTDINVADTVISDSVTTIKNDNNLSGTLDARFYGGAAWELGGIFSLLESNETHALYYFGAFGAQRKGIESGQTFKIDAVTTPEMVNAADTTMINAEIAKNGAYHSLADVADASGENSFTMKALSVYKDDTTSYNRAPNRDWGTYADTGQIINLARLTGSGASLTFNNDGNISGVTAYLNQTYTAMNNSNTSETSFTGTDDGADTETTNDDVDLSVDRSDIFGFNSNYMAYISWALDKSELGGDVQDSIYDISGAMIAGIETKADTILDTTKMVTFNGNGSGTYDDDITDNVEGIDTVFVVTATVDFGASKVTIESSNTCLSTNPSCTLNHIDDWKKFLNFKTNALSFSDEDAIANKISGMVRTDNFVGVNLAGMLDARFYGTAGRELGGTFALLTEATDDPIVNSSYYGAFGAKADFNDQNNLTDFQDSNRSGETNNLLEILNIVRMTKSTTTETITNDKITGAVVVFDYDSDGYFVTNDGLQLYYADKKYEIKAGVASASNSAVQNDSDAMNNGTASVDADNPHTLVLSRANTYFGATQEYMALIHWQVNDDDGSGNTNYNSYGYGIAGFETATIPSGGTNVSFTGKGGGIYNSETESYATEFTVTAIVDFTMSDVAINSSATMKCTDDSVDFASCTKEADGGLDFTMSQIKYTANAISGDVALKGDAGFKGMLDARFYGTNAEEIGGTFSMKSGIVGYIGFFGAKKQE